MLFSCGLEIVLILIVVLGRWRLNFEGGFLVTFGFHPNDEVGAFEGFVVTEAEVLPPWDRLSVDGELGRGVECGL